MKQKSLVKNSIYNVAYKTLNVVFPLVTAAYIARVLLASGVGKVAYAQNIVKYFSTIAALGIPNYGIREISKVRESKTNSSKVFSELCFINFLSTTICVILYYSFIFLVPSFKEERTLYYIVGLTVIFNYLNVDWFYQGFEEFRYIAVRSFVVKLLSLLAIFLFVKTYNDYPKYALISCLGIGGNNIYNFIHLKKYGIRLSFLQIDYKRHLKPVFILLGSAIAIELYTLLDTTMIGALCTNEAVGYYTDSMRLVKIMITVITAIAGVLLPRMSYYHSIGDQEQCNSIVSKVFSVMLFLFIPCEIGLIQVAEQLVPFLFGNSFIPAITTLRIGSLLICVLGFSNLFGTQVLLTYGQEKKLLYTTIVGAVTNITLNSVLIPNFQQNGAAVASVISEMAVTTLSIVFAVKYIKIKLQKSFMYKTILSAAIMCGGVAVIQLSNLTIMPKLFVSCLTGIALYFLANLITKNPILYDLVKILRKRRSVVDV